MKGSTFTYYLFDGTNLIKIPELDGAGELRSVAKESDVSYVAVFSNTTSNAYRITENKAEITVAAKKIGAVVGSKISKKFSSFIYNGYLCYAFDGSSSFNTFNLTTKQGSSTTVSKISNVAIVGYYSVDNNGTYRVCTSNNGFFTLNIDGNGKVTIN